MYRFDSFRPAVVSVLALLLAGGLGLIATRNEKAAPPRVGKARDAGVRAEVVAASPLRPAAAGAMRASGFTENVQLGFDVGDGWEPAIADDDYGHVYVVYSQYGGVPGCPDCTSPSTVVQVSDDGGRTWGSPGVIIPGGGHPNDGQWDPQVVVDPVDGFTVYALWMQNFKDDLALAKSTDFGATWTVTIADATHSINDKPNLLVRGQDLYVAYGHLSASTFMKVSASHDGGETFTSYQVKNGTGGLPLPAGGAITSDGTVYFSWGSYSKPGNGTGEITLFVIKSADGGATWETMVIDHAWPGPECVEPCGWAFLSSQMVMTADAADNLYLLWDGSDFDEDPGRMYFSRSSDGGATWSPKTDVSTAAAGVNHNFPAIAARGDGEVAIAWMDARASGPFSQTYWNTWYRSSTDGGATWSDEVRLSSYVPGYTYVFPEGYSFPYGDYFEIDYDAAGDVHAVWGAGESYFGAGDVWYSSGR